MVIEIGGVNIGEAGDSRDKVVEAFAREGVKIASAHIPQLRAGRASGSIIDDRYACASLFRSGSPFEKDQLYEQIAKTAISPDIRLPNLNTPGRFTSAGFTNRLTQTLGFPDSTVVDEIFRAMRTEAVMSSGNLPADVLSSFNSRVYDYLNTCDHRSSRSTSPIMGVLFNLRVNDTVFTPDNFYRVLYTSQSRRFIGAWATHEMDWFIDFYAFRLQQGIFSLFDKEVLKETAQGRQGLLPKKIKEETGIPINRWVIETHTKALLGRIQLRD